jgi:hypothetical protein
MIKFKKNLEKLTKIKNAGHVGHEKFVSVNNSLKIIVLSLTLSMSCPPQRSAMKV